MLADVELAAGAEAGLASGETGGKLRHSSDRNEIVFCLFLVTISRNRVFDEKDWVQGSASDGVLLGIYAKRWFFSDFRFFRVFGGKVPSARFTSHKNPS